MSFILDALKKSEAERQRKAVPGFADIPEGRIAPKAPRWWWVIGALLAVNLAVLAGVLLRPADTKPNETESLATEKKVEVPVPVPVQPAAFSDIVAEARRNRPEQEPQTTTEPQRQEQAATAPKPAPAASSTTNAALPTLNELRANGTLQLPDMHLDIHVYSDEPAERFVFINMSKYKEAATLSEGPRVREIRPDGVVLEHRGTRFLMPRQ